MNLYGSVGNLISALASLILGIYSLVWSLTSDEASGVDVCNSLLVVVNGLVNA